MDDDGESKDLTKPGSKSLSRAERRSQDVERFLGELSFMAAAGHKGPVNQVCFSPDGSLFATGSDDHTAKLWDTISGRLIHDLIGHKGSVWSVCFSHQGAYLVTSSKDCTVKLWEVISGRLLYDFTAHRDLVRSVSIGPEDDVVASGSNDKTVKIWSSVIGAQLHDLLHDSMVSSLGFSPTGNQLVTGSLDGTIRVWNMISGQLVRVMEGHKGVVSCVSFNSNGNLLASGGWDGVIKVWGPDNDQPLHNLYKSEKKSIGDLNEDGVITLFFSPVKNQLVSASGVYIGVNAIRLWNAASGELLKEFYVPNLKSINLNTDGSTLVVGSRDCTIKLWHIESGEELYRLIGHTGSVNSVCFDSVGSLILSGSSDGTVKLWDALSGSQLNDIGWYTNQTNSVCFGLDGATVLSSHYDGTIKWWDLSSGKMIHNLEGGSPITSSCFSLATNRIFTWFEDSNVKMWDVNCAKISRRFPNLKRPVSSVSASPDGKMLAIAGHHSLEVFSIERAQLVKDITSYRFLRSITFLPNSTQIACCLDSGKIGLWDVDTGLLVQNHNFDNISKAISICYSPDGDRIACGSWDGYVVVWDATHESILFHCEQGGEVTAVCFSPDGSQVTSGSSNGVVLICDMVKMHQFQRLVHGGAVTSVAFSPDGGLLASGSSDGSLKIWDSGSGRLLATFLSVGRGGWMTYTRDGYFIGSDEAVKKVMMKWEHSGNQYPPDTFPRDNPNPQKVAEALASGRSKKQKPRNPPRRPAGLSGKRQPLLPGGSTE